MREEDECDRDSVRRQLSARNSDQMVYRHRRPCPGFRILINELRTRRFPLPRQPDFSVSASPVSVLPR